MPSLIPGYEYDIFISYRQKDNKGDRWVSKFVEALKTELEATFKEDVSVYFDENPHDRLQETHNVDKSLENKLKCLIFIPVLSQTYCDPNSYAWQHEFLAFLRMMQNDRFGRDVKIRGSNVASRILPVRIHDLEPEDVKLFEKETGSALRAMDFVFRTGSGAIRPLLPNEDHPNDNLYKTFYRDQISKVAIAVKEIVTGMRTELSKTGTEKEPPVESPTKVSTEEKQEIKGTRSEAGIKRYLVPVALCLLLIISGIIVYPKIFRSDALAKLKASGERISVAVMPFQNMTNDTALNVWQDGIQDILITSLSNSGEMKVRQRESVTDIIQMNGLTNYSSITPSLAGNLSQKLDANIFIIGSINKEGSMIRINAQLIDSRTNEVFKSFQAEGHYMRILPVIDTLAGRINDYLIISKLIEDLPVEFQQQYVFSNSTEAFRNFIYGNNAYINHDWLMAINYLSQAVAKDSAFHYAAIRLAMVLSNQGLLKEGKKLCLKLYKERDKMPLQLKLLTDRVYSLYFESPHEELKCLKELLEFDDQSPYTYYGIGRVYVEVLQEYDKAIPALEKSLEIYNKWGSKPLWVFNYVHLGNAYHKTGQYKKEKKLYRKAIEDFPDEPSLLFRQVVLALSEGNTNEANDLIKKYRLINEENLTSEATITANLARIYSEAGILDKAEEYYRKSLSLDPDNPGRIYSLAAFLIVNDRNLNEGFELIIKALEIHPENYTLLQAKGWALYKQGKYPEALEILQKSWDLRMQDAVYHHQAYLQLNAAKKAVDSLKRNN